MVSQYIWLRTPLPAVPCSLSVQMPRLPTKRGRFFTCNSARARVIPGHPPGVCELSLFVFSSITWHQTGELVAHILCLYPAFAQLRDEYDSSLRPPCSLNHHGS